MVIQVVAFRKSAGVTPKNQVTYLKACILNAYRHSVLCARACEGQQVPPRLEHAQALGPNFRAGYVIVPFFAHERQAVWWVSHDAVHAVISHAAQHIQAVAQHQIDAAHAVTRTSSPKSASIKWRLILNAGKLAVAGLLTSSMTCWSRS